MFNIELGKFLARLRQEKNLTQEQLAEKLHIDKRKISRWECGNSPPEFELLIKLQDIFNVTLYELAIGKRLDNYTLIEKAKKKFKTIKDLKRFNRRKKLTTFISIIFGIILGLSLIFTIDNYNTTKVYTIRSIDENFAIEGNFTKTRDYNTLNVISLTYLEKDKSKININVYDIEYEILKDNTRVLLNNPKSIKSMKKEKVNLLNAINTARLSHDNADLNNYDIDENDILTFRIKYKINNDFYESVSFEFKLVPKYKNNFLYFFNNK